MKQIVFVCTGNTCRSPMAAALFRAHDGEARTGLTASSAGMFAHEGLPASENAVLAVRELGGALSAHRARQLPLERFPQAADKIYTLSGRDVGDPFGGDLTVYRASAAAIDEAIEALIRNLERKA